MLAHSRPRIADICERPSLLLNIPSEWPGEARPKVFEFLDRTYDDLISKAASSGAVRLYDVRRMPQVGNRFLRGGGFAVPKDTDEDRWI